ncbi:MAG: undecaprenyl-diphosphatase, partial [Marinomonas sp.]
SIEVIAYTTIGFGVLLWFSDHFFSQTKVLKNLQLPNVAMIGLAQAFALIPGTSRSGVTMTAARLMGFDRSSAARFSFLLSIPVIVAAGSYKSMELVVSSAPVTVDFSAIFWGVVLSALSAYLCIHLFLKWLNQIGFLPFMLYRLVLGVFLLWLVKMS